MSTVQTGEVAERAIPVDLDAALAIPYILVIYSLSRNGNWYRHAEYPELPGCVAEGLTAVEAIDRLELRRVEIIVDLYRKGIAVPCPRAPLRSGFATYGSFDLSVLVEELLGRGK